MDPSSRTLNPNLPVKFSRDKGKKHPDKHTRSITKGHWHWHVTKIMSYIFLLKCHEQDAKLPRAHDINITSAVSPAKSAVTKGFQSYRTSLEQFSASKSPQQDEKWTNKKEVEKANRKRKKFHTWMCRDFKIAFYPRTTMAHFLMQVQLQTKSKPFLPDEFLAIHFHPCSRL